MYEKIKNITSLIRSRLGIADGHEPQVGIILGSGLGALADRVVGARILEYGDIEGFPVSQVKGHAGRFVYGVLGGKRVIVMQGRVHFYEGYQMQDVVLGVRALCAMGINTLIVTNAAGGLHENWRVGDIMLIEDQINLMPNPLIGANLDQFGERFVDMNEAYSLEHRELAVRAATNVGVELRCGTYLASTGPTYETPSEYRFFSTVGADACGMSTVGEVIVARHHGVRVLGFSLISNIAFGEAASATNSHSEVLAASAAGASDLIKIVEQCLHGLE